MLARVSESCNSADYGGCKLWRMSTDYGGCPADYGGCPLILISIICLYNAHVFTVLVMQNNGP